MSASEANRDFGFEQCSTVAELHERLRAYAEASGFEFFIYATMLVSNPAQPLRFTVSGFPRDWRTRYDKMGYINTDPVIRHCLGSLRPIFWDEVARDDALTRAFFDDAARHGLVSGITCPVFGKLREVGAVSLATSRKISFSSEQRAEMLHSLHWNAMMICEAFERVALTAQHDGSRNPLSDREKDILCMVAGGQPDRSISKRLGISESTVRFHITRAGEKLGGISGRHQIVAHAQAMGRLGIDQRSLSSKWAQPQTSEYQA